MEFGQMASSLLDPGQLDEIVSDRVEVTMTIAWIAFETSMNDFTELYWG
jgi:hypothetical protein